MRPALELREITRHYQAGVGGCFASVRALDSVSLLLREGEVAGVVGAPGSGKSTLLLCAAGLLRVDAGSVAWFGRQPAEPPNRPPADVAFVPARAGYYPFLTVREALEHYAVQRGGALAGDGGETHRALERVGLADRAGERVSRLASCALRRLALAQALLARPRLLLLDDPFAGATGSAWRRVAALLADLAREGVAVLLTSSDAASVEGVVRRAIRLERGRVAEETVHAGPAAQAGQAVSAAIGDGAPSRALELRVGAAGVDGAALARALAGTAGDGTAAAAGDAGIGAEPVRRSVRVEWRGDVLRVPLVADASPEEVLAACRALGVTVHESRVVALAGASTVPAERRVAEPGS